MRGLSNTSQFETLQTIMTALRVCYGSLVEPDFHEVSEKRRASPFDGVIDTLRESGISVTETTDSNDDVSICLVLDRSGDQVGLMLSGVGPFAAITHQDSAGDYSWVTHSAQAPTPLAATVAQTVQQAGFQLLDRSLVSQSIAMNWYDGSTEVTLYQALFTDTDRIP